MASRRLKEDKKVEYHEDFDGDADDESDDGLDNLRYEPSRGQKAKEPPTPKPISTPAPGAETEDDADSANAATSDEDDDDDEEESCSSSSDGADHALEGPSDDEKDAEPAAAPKESKANVGSAAKAPTKSAKRRQKYYDREGSDSDDSKGPEVAEWRQYWTKK